MWWKCCAITSKGRRVCFWAAVSTRVALWRKKDEPYHASFFCVCCSEEKKTTQESDGKISMVFSLFTVTMAVHIVGPRLCFGSSVNDFWEEEEEETAFSFFRKEEKIRMHSIYTTAWHGSQNTQGIALYHNNNKQATAWQCMHVFQAGMDVFSLTWDARH